MNEVASGNGHTLTWKRLPREPKGHALAFEGTCGDCGATVEIGKGWSSCRTIRNARDTSARLNVHQEGRQSVRMDLVAPVAMT